MPSRKKYDKKKYLHHDVDFMWRCERKHYMEKSETQTKLRVSVKALKVRLPSS